MLRMSSSCLPRLILAPSDDVLAARACSPSAQVELAQMQIKVKAVNAAMAETKQYLEKLPDFLKDVEKSLVPLKKCVE